MPPLVWLITGTSSGIGRELVIAALRRGDHVIATARGTTASLDDLKAMGAHVLRLDVTEPLDSLHETAKSAIAIYGRVDVLVNNAGYLHTGTIEESSPEETFNQFNTNVFGAMNVARAFLPYMRERKFGTVLWIGSVFGWITAGATSGLYDATKFAIRAVSQNLDKEISPLGLRSVCVDFGFFRTPVLVVGKRTPPIFRIADYAPFSTKGSGLLETYNGAQPGDPKKGANTLIDLMHGEGRAAGKTIPSSILLGKDCFEMVQADMKDKLRIQDEWEEFTKSTDLEMQ